MTVSELISELQQFDGEQQVQVSYGSNDYWSTVIAKDIDNIEVGSVIHSSYHRCNKVVTYEHEYDRNGSDGDDQEDDMSGEHDEVVLLNLIS